MPVTQFAVTDTYEYLNGFGGYKEYDTSAASILEDDHPANMVSAGVKR